MKIAQIEVRTEDDPDVAPYVCQRQIEIVKCDSVKPTNPTQTIREDIYKLMEAPLNVLLVHRLVTVNSPSFLNLHMIIEVER